MMAVAASRDSEAGEPVRPRVLVSVLVPTLNEESQIADVAARLGSQRLDGEAEFLFIDGRSQDGTRAQLARLQAEDPRIRILDNPRGGIPFALNIGLRTARGEFVARMDAHTLYPSDYLARGIERLSRGDGVVWVSGPQLAHGVDRWSRRVAVALGTRLGIGGARFRRLGREIEVDAGFTGVWRRETLLEHHGWDEAWAVNEDGELAARIRAAGGVIVCAPEMAARYIPRSSLRSLARQYWRYGIFRAKTCRAHPESMRASHALPPGLVLALPLTIVPVRPLAVAARAGFGGYLLALLGSALSVGRRVGPREAFWSPLILMTMHFAWGGGFLLGASRFGPPLRALTALIRRG